MKEQTKANIVKAVEKQTKERITIIFPDDTFLITHPPTVHEIMADIMKEVRA